MLSIDEKRKLDLILKRLEDTRTKEKCSRCVNFFERKNKELTEIFKMKTYKVSYTKLINVLDESESRMTISCAMYVAAFSILQAQQEFKLVSGGFINNIEEVQ